MMHILSEIILQIFYHEQTWLIGVVLVKCMMCCAFSNFIKGFEVWTLVLSLADLIPSSLGNWSVTEMEIMKAADCGIKICCFFFRICHWWICIAAPIPPIMKTMEDWKKKAGQQQALLDVWKQIC